VAAIVAEASADQVCGLEVGAEVVVAEVVVVAAVVVVVVVVVADPVSSS
jgi:hypothetical protein